MHIPPTGQTGDQIIDQLRSYKQNDPDWSTGKVFNYIFEPEAETAAVVEQAYTLYMWNNALDPIAFGSTKRIENELVAMCRTHLNGDDDVVGNITSGGTESIMLALKAARDWARATRPSIDTPELILPITAHPAFHKAAHYLGINAITVGLDSTTLTVDIDAVRAAISPNTIALIGSASCYAFGTVDPITELGRLAIDHDLWLHVDGCIGGFVLGWYEQLGHSVTPFDFRVPGVTSISMDLHKYAFAAVGASCVLYKNLDARRHAIFTHSDWTGYTLTNPTVLSSRSGGPMAGAWAVMQHLGQAGYRDYMARLRSATAELVAGINAIPELTVMGQPETCMLAFTSETVDVFALCEAMQELGWTLAIQPGTDNIPAAIHVTIKLFNTEYIQQLLTDLKTGIQSVAGVSFRATTDQLVSMLAGIDVATIDDAMIDNLLGMVGMADTGNGPELPANMAEITAILSALPPQLTDKVIKKFFNEWMR